jgi:hypothetical protein
MPDSDAEDTKKLLIFVEVVDKAEIHVGVFSTPPGLDEDGTDQIVVSLNKANAAVLKSLEESDTEDIMRLVELGADTPRLRLEAPLPAGRHS